MAHDVFDVVPEDPEIQHIADQMHPATVEKHAGENSGVRRNRDDLRGERRLTEHDGGNGAEPVDEGFAGGRTQGALVEKDEGAGDDERDGDDRRSLGRVIVTERQHRDLMKRGPS